MSAEAHPIKFTFKVWLPIAALTIGLCYLTQLVAEWFGIELREQKNVEILRQLFAHAFDSWKYFWVSMLNVSLVLVLLPFFEELVFRGGLFKLVTYLTGLTRVGAVVATAAVSSVLFSSAHYLAQPFPDNAFIALFFFGLVQCWLYRRTGSIWCAVLNHGLFNLTNLVLLLLIPV